jgi:large subunit ribosomal protein L4
MAEAKVRNLKNEEVRSLDLPDAVYGAPLRRHLLYQAVHHQLAALRAGTASTKTRGEVEGSGRKLWRQKKTGRARVGSIRSPLWRKGGTVHGPKPRSYDYPLPRKMRRGAICSALSQRLREGRLVLVESLELPEPKTRRFLDLLEGLELRGSSVLVVDEADNRNLLLASRNVPRVAFATPAGIDVHGVLGHRYLLMSAAAAARLGERLS